MCRRPVFYISSNRHVLQTRIFHQHSQLFKKVRNTPTIRVHRVARSFFFWWQAREEIPYVCMYVMYICMRSTYYVVRTCRSSTRRCAPPSGMVFLGRATVQPPLCSTCLWSCLVRWASAALPRPCNGSTAFVFDGPRVVPRSTGLGSRRRSTNVGDEGGCELEGPGNKGGG